MKTNYAKIQITGKIEVVTGMHIGGSSAFSAIGAVDSPIMKDARTNLPLLPGSSLKGKMRTLLARSYNTVWNKDYNVDDERILRLFGSSKKEHTRKSRLLFSDMILSNVKELHDAGVNSLTEVKFENSINRVTAVANPRQIERAIRGSVFPLDLVYDVQRTENFKEEEIAEDFALLAEGIKLLQYDYIGGNGSRGYGKIKFHELEAKVVIGDVDEGILESCNQYLKEVAYE